jgi:hypothetical protein
MSTWSSRLANRRAALAGVAGPGDRLLLLRIFAVAVSVPLLMRLPLPRLAGQLEPSGAPSCPTPAQEARLVQAVLGVLRAGRPLVRRGCLTRGVTLYYFLRRAGVDVSLVFGMGASADQPDGFDGHCWLTKNGEPYLEQRDPRPCYTPMYSFPLHPERHA